MADFTFAQRFSERFNLLGEVSQRIISILELDELLTQVTRLIQQTFKYYHVGIGLIEGDEVVYRVGAGTLWDDPNFEFKPARLKVGKEGVTGWVAGCGKPLLLLDVRADPRYVWMRGSETKSELTVPIIVKGVVMAVLDLQSDQLNDFDWEMQGLVTLGVDPVSGIPQYQSGEDVIANGVELSDQTWNWGGRLRGSVSYQDVTYAGGADLNNSPQLLGKLNFSGPLAATGLRFGFELQYSSERQTLSGIDLNDYWLSNLQLSTDTWAKGLEVSLGLYNLFDTHYEHPASEINWQNAMEQDGRSARLKLTYSF